MTLDQCYNQNVGKSLLIPGGGAGNEGQCVQWADTVLHDVYGFDYHWGNAIDWWNNPGELLNNFDKITDGSIKKGDFVIFNTLVGSPYGHIDVAMQDGTVGNFLGADSNWGGNKTVHLVQHSNSNYVLGSLRLKQGEDMPTIVDPYLRDQIVNLTLYAPDQPQRSDPNYGLGGPVNNLLDDIDRNPKKLQLLYPQALQQIEALKNELGQKSNVDPNSIVITQKGWAALWAAARTFFSKNS